MNFDVLIIGGGVIGLTTAVRCAQQQLSVGVLEGGQVGQEASWAGAGMIPPGDLGHGSMAYHQLTRKSSQLWSDLTAEIQQATGLENGYRVCGSLQPTAMASLAEELEQWEAQEIPCQLLQGEQLKPFCEQISSQWQQALWFPTAAQVRNPWHLKALEQYARQLGVTIIDGQAVKDFSRTGETVDQAITPEGAYSAGQYLVTAGAWSSLMTQTLGIEIPIHPLRGQIALLKGEQPLFSCLIECGKQYLVPREDGHLLIGSTEEYAGYEKQTTDQGIQSLLEFGQSILPQIQTLELKRQWAGLRPSSPDGMPIMGRLSGYENVFIATGHSRAGLTLSPVTAELMTDLIVNNHCSELLTAFDGQRFENDVVHTV